MNPPPSEEVGFSGKNENSTSQESSPQICASLTSSFHVNWMTEAIGQAFSLSLEDIGVIANASAIYITWLLNPSKRPAYIQSTGEEARQEFFQSLFRHISVLFQPKTLDVALPSKSAIAALASKHVELCKTILRALTQAAINSKANAPMSQFSCTTWKVLLRILLGITDHTLRIPSQPYSYFAEELGESFLSTLIESLFRSEMFSWEIWKRLRACYPVWSHRMTSIIQWNAFSLALTQRVTKIIYGQGTNALVYTVHANLVTIEVSDEFAIYSWHNVLSLLAPPSHLPSPIFLRAVLGIEKLVQIFLSISKVTLDGGLQMGEKACSESNTILSIFGAWLFEAASLENQEYHEGRAQALGILCRLIARPQNRQPLHTTYLYQFYAAILDGLKRDLLSVVFIIVNSEDIFALGLPGIRVLIPSFVGALRRIVPLIESPLRLSLNMEDLRRACYKLMCTMFSFCGHFSDIKVQIALPRELDQVKLELHHSRLEASPSKTSLSVAMTERPRPIWIERLYQIYPTTLNKPASLGSHRVEILEILMLSLLHETDPGNARYLINALSAFTIDETKRLINLSVLFTDFLSSLLCSGKWGPEVCLLAIESLKQLTECQASIFQIDRQCIPNFLKSFSVFIIGLMDQNYHSEWSSVMLLGFDCIMAWLSPCSAPWLISSLDCQNALLRLFTLALNYAAQTVKTPEASYEKLRASPSKASVGSKSPSVSNISPPRKINDDRQLATAAKIALTALLQILHSGRDNPFIPFTISSISNEALLLGQFDGLSFSSENLQSALKVLPEMDLDKLRYYIVADELLICIVEHQDEKLGTKSNSDKSRLLILVRSLCGRFTWESSLEYWPKKLQKPSMALENNNYTFPPFPPGVGQAFKLADGGDSTVDAGSGVLSIDSIPLLEQKTHQWKNRQDSKNFVNFKVISNLQNAQCQKVMEALDDCLRGSTEPYGDGGDGERMIKAILQDPVLPLGHMHRLFMAHTLLSGTLRPPTLREVTLSPALINDLQQLDSIGEREVLSICVFYISSARQSLYEILSQEQVSEDFYNFLLALGWPMETARHLGFGGSLSDDKVAKTFPYYADDQVEVVFHSPTLLDPSGLCKMASASVATEQALHPAGDEIIPPHAVGLYKLIIDNLVSILWIEDLDDMLSLPRKLQTNSLVFICISPLKDSQSIGLYRIRIMVTSSNLKTPSNTPQGSLNPAGGEALYLLGPLLDGMIVRRESLGPLVRKTAISAASFCLYSLQQKTKPYPNLMINDQVLIHF